MMPIFLDHSALDVLLPTNPTTAQANGHGRLCALRERAIAQGAHVLLLVWPTLEWSMLAVEVPPGVEIENTSQLIPNLLANPDALAQMQYNAREGQHLSWLHLVRPASTTH